MKIPVVEQHDSSDCGVACVASICSYYGQEFTIVKLRELLGTDIFGTSINGISQGLEKLGFVSRPVYVDRKSFEKGNYTLPAIARLVRGDGTAHYVAVYSVKGNRVTYMDPAEGRPQKRSMDEFYECFDGGMIMMAPDEHFTRSKSESARVFSGFKALIRPHWSIFCVAIGISVIVTIFAIILSLFNKILIDEIIPYREEHQLALFAVVLLIVTAVQVILGAFRAHVLLYLSQKIDIPLMLGYFRHIFRLPMAFFSSRKTGDIVTRFQDAGVVKNVLTSAALSVIIDVSMIAIIGIFLYVTSSVLFAVTIVMAVLGALIIYCFKAPYRKLNRASMEQGAKLNSKIIESLNGIESVKTNSCEEHIMEGIESEFIRSLRISFRGGVLSNIQGSVSSALTSGGNLLVLVLGGFLVIGGSLTLGGLIAFISLSGYFIGPIERLVGLQLSIQEADISLKRLSEIYEVEEEENSESGKSSDAVNGGIGDIWMDNVSFRYGSRPLTVRDVSLRISKGEKVALVGRSGSGKTTISKLMLKFYVPEEGRVLINGTDSRDINAFALRDRIGCVPQNVELFSGTIRENLLLGREGVSRGEIDRICDITGCSEFIRKLPAGYDNFLDENGGGLSGGEKQRIAIARALLRRPDFLIFDEATSNMDFITERNTYDVIFNMLMDLPVLIIAHRLSTIRRCDRIYVMDEGKITEYGTHDELIAKGGLYSEMWKTQIGNVGDDDSCPVEEETTDGKHYDGEVIEYGE